MTHRRAAALLVAAVMAMLATTLTGFSSAAFTSRTTATATVSAASDWTPPTVSVVSPGPSVKDTVTVSANAGDAESGVRDVTLQYLAAGASSWTTLCTDTTAPYSCSWATRGLPDGPYDLRARAVDNAGYATTSATVRTVVSNTVMVVLTDPGEVLRGTVPLSATVHNPGTLTWTVTIEAAPAGTTRFSPVCSALTSPWSCTWTSTSLASADYDFRAVARAGSSTTITSAVVHDVTVDNTAPTATMVDPGTPLSGTRTLAATVSDAHSGVAQVVIQHAPTGTSTWATTCTITSEPWSCRFATTTIPDGSYSFRAVVTDVAGNSVTTTNPVTNRQVNNTVSSVSIDPPAAYLSGTVQLAASASSTAGVTWVQLQYAPAGTTTWTEACTVSTAPYTCAWNTAPVADGLYDLRAVMLDGSKVVTTSAVESGRRVDNTPLRGLDVQTGSGGPIAGRPDAGDTITFTWTDQIAPASVLSGWTGAATPVSVRLRDGNALGTGNKGDTLDVLVGNQAVNLGSVNLREDFVKPNKSVTLAGTMTASTVTVDGLVRSTVTITLGAVTGGQAGSLRTVSNPSTMVWSPSGNVTDLRGLRSSTAPTTETGALDREF